MRCVGPADVEQFFEINGIVFRGLQYSLAIARMNGGLIARKKTGPDPSPRSAQCQGSSKPAAVGNTTRCKDEQSAAHSGNEWHRCDVTTHMTPGFPSLCDNGVNPARYCVPRFRSRANGVEDCGTTRLCAGHKA